MVRAASLTMSLLALLCGSAVADSPLTLEQYLAQVRLTNPSLSASQLRAEAAEHRIAPSSTLDDPFFAAGPDEIPFGGGEGSVIKFQLSQTIPFPGKLGAKGDAATARAETAKSDASTQERTLLTVATQVYYRAYLNQQAIELNERTQKIVTETIESTKARYTTGGAGHHDWLLAKIERGVLDVEALRLKRERKSLIAIANELRGVQPSGGFELAKTDFESLDQGKPEVEPALPSQPELNASRAMKNAAEADERSARLSYFPDLVLQGMLMKPTMMDSGMSSNWGVMAGINLPLYFWRKQSEQVSAAKAEQAASERDLQALENRLGTEVIDAKEQLKTARDVVSLYKAEVLPATEMAAKNARAGYAARRLPLTQYLDILRIERTQKLELLAAHIDVELSKTRLKQLLSSPPMLRLAPSRPSLFGAEGMASEMGGPMGAMPNTSATTNLGGGMSGPTRKAGPSSSSGEKPMGGM